MRFSAHEHSFDDCLSSKRYFFFHSCVFFEKNYLKLCFVSFCRNLFVVGGGAGLAWCLFAFCGRGILRICFFWVIVRWFCE